MEKPKKQVRVTRTSDHRSPAGVRRLGRALIALAEAQLEAEAQAQTEAKSSQKPRRNNVARPKNHTDHPTGDAA